MPGVRQTAVPETIFGIPRKDGKVVVGQVLETWKWYTGIMCIAVFDCVTSLAEAIDLSVLPTSSVMSVTSTANAAITKRYWTALGSLPVLVDPRFSPHRKFAEAKYAGAMWHSSLIIEDLVNAYYGFSTWEPYPGRPGHLRSLLFPVDRENPRAPDAIGDGLK